MAGYSTQLQFRMQCWQFLYLVDQILSCYSIVVVVIPQNWCMFLSKVHTKCFEKLTYRIVGNFQGENFRGFVAIH